MTITKHTLVLSALRITSGQRVIWSFIEKSYSFHVFISGVVLLPYLSTVVFFSLSFCEALSEFWLFYFCVYLMKLFILGLFFLFVFYMSELLSFLDNESFYFLSVNISNDRFILYYHTVQCSSFMVAFFVSSWEASFFYCNLCKSLQTSHVPHCSLHS